MNTPYRILTITGEVSGDRIAASALRKTTALAGERGIRLDLFGIGGDDCTAAGMLCHYAPEEMQVVGFLEVAKKFRFFRTVLHEMVELLDHPPTRPDVVFLIDYPGFNLRFAREAKARGIRVVYYVSPQVWAWKPGRIKQIVRSVDTMLVIFPFEADLYRKAGMPDVRFVGHPLVELLDDEVRTFSAREEFAARMSLPADKPWLLIFPGSREEEVRRHSLDMIDGARMFGRNDYLPVIVKSPSVHESYYSSISKEIHVFRGSSRDIHELMHHASIGVFKSGTTTLEAGLTKTPGVICYRTSKLTYELARRMMKLDMIGLVNIVLGRPLYPELIQDDMTGDNIASALADVASRYQEFIRDLDGLHHHLRGDGPPPSEQVADVLLQ